MTRARALASPYAFLVRPTSEQSNFATGSVQTVAFGTEVFDQSANFASNTFTAPVTGKYQLSCSVYVTAVDSASTYYEASIRTSNRNYFVVIDPDFGQDAGFWAFTLSVLADMDASDTATVGIVQASGTAQTDIGTSSFFSGILVA